MPTLEGINEGDLVYLTAEEVGCSEEAKAFLTCVAAWYKDGNAFVVKKFPKNINGVFLSFAFTNNGDGHWYNVIISDKVYYVNGRQIQKAI